MIKKTTDAKINQSIILNMKQIMNSLADHQTANDDKEMKWLILNNSNETLKDILPKLTVLMLHVVEAIYDNGPVNCTRISESTTIPKGTVSKVTKKLMQFDLIFMTFLPNNKKERLYQTTSLGTELSILHDALHKNAEFDFNNIFNKYQPAELEIFNDILGEFKDYFVE